MVNPNNPRFYIMKAKWDDGTKSYVIIDTELDLVVAELPTIQEAKLYVQQRETFG